MVNFEVACMHHGNFHYTHWLAVDGCAYCWSTPEGYL